MIRARTVRVIDPDGNQLGVLPIEEALRLADEAELDLVEVAPTAQPPVCRIMNYGKFKYQQSKRKAEAKKKQKQHLMKEVQFGVKIENHDYRFKVEHVKRFLGEGNKVKVVVKFRGRENAHPELGTKLLDQIVSDLQDLAAIERPARKEGRHMIMILGPSR